MKCPCGKTAVAKVPMVVNPEWAAMVVASVYGVLTAADFKEVGMCEQCAEAEGVPVWEGSAL